MGITSIITSLWGKDEEQAAETYRYRCGVCHSVFKSAEPHIMNVTCTNCGSMEIEEV